MVRDGGMPGRGENFTFGNAAITGGGKQINPTVVSRESPYQDFVKKREGKFPTPKDHRPNSSTAQGIVSASGVPAAEPVRAAEHSITPPAKRTFPKFEFKGLEKENGPEFMELVPTSDPRPEKYIETPLIIDLRPASVEAWDEGSILEEFNSLIARI